MSSVSTISHEERPLPQCVSTTLEWRHDYTWMSSYNPLVHFVFLLLPLLCYPNNLVTTHTWMISIQTPCDFLFFFLSLSFFFLFSSLVPALLSEPVLLLELVPIRFVLQRSRREFFLRLLIKTRNDCSYLVQANRYVCGQTGNIQFHKSRNTLKKVPAAHYSSSGTPL